jgi:hypothetical protein
VAITEVDLDVEPDCHVAFGSLVEWCLDRSGRRHRVKRAVCDYLLVRQAPRTRLVPQLSCGAGSWSRGTSTCQIGFHPFPRCVGEQERHRPSGRCDQGSHGQ